MSDLTVSPDLLRPAAAAPTAPNRDKIEETAKAFEATFISQMLKPMFEGLSTDGLFGGGQGEATWRSFMLDEMAKSTVKAGGIGLSNTVMAEMLKMQEGRQ
ncbi:MAG: rod-binding protein [Brevundimonas sp.]|uniref:Rod-binding protein n=1 Tax=Brevundimonas intermedia TaxID=74315 RepID=A0A4Y9RV64_9CAUL|nr:MULTISPECIES: rod-binding protein [Brevundimonas]TFW12763.1 rod-binding protein [Brevundimonas intermedia]VXA91211.1 Flagellar protein flgJ (peptidoglycan hydrolase) [Brevundimonas sp. G8]